MVLFAPQSKRLPIIELLRSHVQPGVDNLVAATAAGDMDLVRYYVEQCHVDPLGKADWSLWKSGPRLCVCGVNAIQVAAFCGFLELVVYLFPSWSKRLSLSATAAEVWDFLDHPHETWLAGALERHIRLHSRTQNVIQLVATLSHRLLEEYARPPPSLLPSTVFFSRRINLLHLISFSRRRCLFGRPNVRKMAFRKEWRQCHKQSSAQQNTRIQNNKKRPTRTTLMEHARNGPQNRRCQWDNDDLRAALPRSTHPDGPSRAGFEVCVHDHSMRPRYTARPARPRVCLSGARTAALQLLNGTCVGTFPFRKKSRNWPASRGPPSKNFLARFCGCFVGLSVAKDSVVVFGCSMLVVSALGTRSLQSAARTEGKRFKSGAVKPTACSHLLKPRTNARKMKVMIAGWLDPEIGCIVRIDSTQTTTLHDFFHFGNLARALTNITTATSTLVRDLQWFPKQLFADGEKKFSLCCGIPRAEDHDGVTHPLAARQRKRKHVTHYWDTVEHVFFAISDNVPPEHSTPFIRSKRDLRVFVRRRGNVHGLPYLIV